MPGGFLSRFAIEAGFLILLGVGAGIADLRPAVIVALLAGGWLLVSLIELGVWRMEARVASPRMPPVALPEPGPEVGWPLEYEDEEAPEDDDYPLRPDAGVETSEAAEEYTRVLGAPERAEPDDRSDS
jgi:hypothetical protein